MDDKDDEILLTLLLVVIVRSWELEVGELECMIYDLPYRRASSNRMGLACPPTLASLPDQYRKVFVGHRSFWLFVCTFAGRRQIFATISGTLDGDN